MTFFANEARFTQIQVFFRACSLQNEVGDPPFFYITDITNSSSFNGKIFRKKSMLENFRANVLKFPTFDRPHWPWAWSSNFGSKRGPVQTPRYFGIDLTWSVNWESNLTKGKSVSLQWWFCSVWKCLTPPPSHVKCSGVSSSRLVVWIRHFGLTCSAQDKTPLYFAVKLKKLPVGCRYLSFGCQRKLEPRPG